MTTLKQVKEQLKKNGIAAEVIHSTAADTEGFKVSYLADPKDIVTICAAFQNLTKVLGGQWFRAQGNLADFTWILTQSK